MSTAPSSTPNQPLALEAACASLGLIGRSASFRAALALAGRFARCDAPVLLRGSTGSGKELFARLIHYLSARRGRAFIPVNCGALPDTLVESELFGHVRGAFTDARSDKPGLIALAERGTLFLDEIDSLSFKAQVTLLRFLQDHEYRPVGARTLARADVRVVAASNADLTRAASAGSFRQDLLFRLNVLDLNVPALSERREDILMLARFFLARFAAIYGGARPALDAAAEAWLLAQPWEGNVRELENRTHRAYVLGAGTCISLAAFQPNIATSTPTEAPPAALYSGGLKAARAREIGAFEENYLRGLLAATQGNVSEAARRAGTERRTMGRLLKRHSLDRESFRT